MKTKSLALRLATLTLIFSTLIFTAILAYNYSFSKNIIVNMAEERGAYMTDSTVKRIDGILASVRKVTDSISFSLEEGDLSRERLLELEKRVLSDNPEIFGTAIAFEPHGYIETQKYYAPYHFRTEDGRVVFKNLGGPDYQYFYMDWYQLARELKKPVWTEPYYDVGGGHALMATYSVPFYRVKDGEKKLAGVVTADLSLKRIQELVAEINMNNSGYVFMLSRYGTYMAHPGENTVLNETIFTLAEELRLPKLVEVGRRMIAGESGFEEVDGLPMVGDSFIYFVSLPQEMWSIGVVFPKKEMFAGVTRLNKVVGMIGVFGFVALALFIIYLSGTITRPLRELTRSANEIASGNLDANVPKITTGDEVADLAHSFKTMKSSLKSYIDNLMSTTAAKERIEAELQIARDIQMGILPKLFPAFPDRSEFDIYASIEPAREVGGDLYDFFFIDERHFCFLVGDVSDKGVPAAFFMAITKTLVKVVAERNIEPGEILAKVNDDLADENESCMFVTLFLGIMDVETGEVRYASAGHNPPLHLPSGGTPEWVPPLNEPVAGAMAGIRYTTKTMTMGEGDILFIYTDGVTEAMNDKTALYTDGRLFEFTKRCVDASAEEVIHMVDGSLKEFTGAALQSDDITMLALKFCGKKNTV